MRELVYSEQNKDIAFPIDNDHIMVWHKWMPEEQCDKIVSTAEEEFSKTDGGHLRRTHIDGYTTAFDRRTWMKNKPSLRKDLKENILKLYLEYYSFDYPSLIASRDITTLFDVQVQKTEKFQGYHAFHSDNGVDRVSTFIVYLNDVEEGGETEFLFQQLKIKPEKGTVVIFPCTYAHTHRGNPPISNSKYILTGWITYDENVVYRGHSW